MLPPAARIFHPRPTGRGTQMRFFVDQRLVYHNIGHLHSEDSRAVAQAWQQLAASIVTELREKDEERFHHG